MPGERTIGRRTAIQRNQVLSASLPKTRLIDTGRYSRRDHFSIPPKTPLLKGNLRARKVCHTVATCPYSRDEPAPDRPRPAPHGRGPGPEVTHRRPRPGAVAP